MPAPAPRTAPTRADRVSMWREVEQATSDLKKAFEQGSVPINRLRAWVKAGAIVPLVGIGIYKKALEKDDATAMGLLLAGSEFLEPAAQWSLLCQAVEYGAPKCLALMIDQGFPMTRQRAQAAAPTGATIANQDLRHPENALVAAVCSGQHDIASQLLEAGVASLIVPGEPVGFCYVGDPEMFRVLTGAGLAPNPGDLAQAMRPDSGLPDLEVLGAFLEFLHDKPAATRDLHTQGALERLFHKLPELGYQDPKNLEHLARAAAMLIDAGASWKEEIADGGLPALGPHEMAVLALAGVPMEELMPLADFDYQPRSILQDGWVGAWQAGHCLRILSRHGADIDVFWAAAPSSSKEWKDAMVAAGVDPGEDAAEFTARQLAVGRKARLEDRMSKPGTSAGPKVRL